MARSQEGILQLSFPRPTLATVVINYLFIE